MAHATSNRGTRNEVRQRRPASREVVRLVDRIRALVSEQQSLDGRTSARRLEALRGEIERLQCRLANIVWSELSGKGRNPCTA
jgi:hypothetical protein